MRVSKLKNDPDYTDDECVVTLNGALIKDWEVADELRGKVFTESGCTKGVVQISRLVEPPVVEPPVVVKPVKWSKK